jgi:hypothetical protein
MAVFWDVAPCSLVVYGRFRALKMEAVSTSETSVKFYQTTRRNIPEEAICKFLLFGANRVSGVLIKNQQF